MTDRAPNSSNRSHRRRAGRRTGLSRFARDERGAAYSLSVVMVMPLYALLMCLIVESALVMTAKLGTVYSAFAAARSASVWSSATTWPNTRKIARRAAVQSMAPFASGTQSVRSSAPTSTGTYDDALVYYGAYELFSEDSAVSRKYLLAKYGYASRHTEVTITGPPQGSHDPITVTVTYDFPFNVPGIGRLLGESGPDGYYYAISSQVTLPNEGPRDNRQTIGIGYGILD